MTEETLDSFLAGIKEEDRQKVQASIDFSMTVPQGVKFASVRLSLGVQHFPLEQKSFELAFAEIRAKTISLLQSHGYLKQEGPQ